MKKYYVLLILLFALAAAGCYESEQSAKAAPSGGSGVLSVKYIDVGQADSILITGPEGGHMLIDAGAELGSEENDVIPALEAEGVERLDAVIATHPHYDHIACMDDVIENYDIGTFYLPDTEGSYTSSTYTKMLDELEEYDVNTVYPKVPSEFMFDGASCEFLGPVGNETKNCNEYSLVMKLDWGDTSFLFTGDAGSSSEYNMIDRGFDLSADVLKVGHHGSEYSTTREFLDEVKPSCAVISCGEDNSYGHPSPLTLGRLDGIPVYITKDCGDIVVTSDGKDIEVFTEEDLPKGSTVEKTDEKTGGDAETVYIGNKNSMILHREDCGSLPDEKNRVYFSSAEEAEAEGYKKHTCIK